MPKPRIRRVLPVLAVAVAVVCAGGSAATATATVRAANPADGPAATSTGWRITKVLPNLLVGGLWAGGPRDAWLAGDACAKPGGCGDGQPDNGTVVVRHWDGTAWRSVAAPRAYVNTPLDQGAGTVAATSAHNLWVFAYRGTQDVDHTDALHWTGKSWGKPVRMKAMVEAAVAASPTQVWAFGLADTSAQIGYVAHFDGTTWKAGGFPVEGTSAVSVSANDIWVGGRAASGALVVEHWDGHAWRATTLVKAGSAPSGLSWITGVTAIGSRQVWASVVIADGPDGNPLAFLVRWNGTSWTRVSLPFGGHPVIGTPVASDGHGGIWVVVDIGTGKNLTTWFAHYAGGRWTKTAIPDVPGSLPPPLGQTMPGQLTWIPGTRSLWATGEVDSLDLITAVFKYGP